VALNIGGHAVGDVRIGATQAVAVYAGDVKVWPVGAPVIPPLGRWTWGGAVNHTDPGAFRMAPNHAWFQVSLTDADGTRHSEAAIAATVGGHTTLTIDGTPAGHFISYNLGNDRFMSPDPQLVAALLALTVGQTYTLGTAP
jgi:hypothetical protein